MDQIWKSKFLSALQRKNHGNVDIYVTGDCSRLCWCLSLAWIMASLLWPGPLTVNEAEADSKEAIVFHETFEDSSAKQWSGSSATFVPVKEHGQTLHLVNKDPTGSSVASRKLPAEVLAGNIVTLNIAVKADSISIPAQSWNGVQLELVLQMPHGSFEQKIPIESGTFDWRKESLTLRIPSSIKGARLRLGLQKVSGQIWFDDIEIRTGLPVTGGKRQVTRFRGHPLPRMRGVSHNCEYVKEDLADLASWGANLIRWHLVCPRPANKRPATPKEYREWLQSLLPDLDQAVDDCERMGIRVLLSLHYAPGGRTEDSVQRMFTDPVWRDEFLYTWEYLARRYRNRPIIYAYDLVNEPIEPRHDAIVTWRDLATEATRRIRSIEENKPVVYQPGPGGKCNGFDCLIPLDLDRVIYSFHMYSPIKFTHQFKPGCSPAAYPGIVDSEYWNKERLREAMLPAIEFQKRYNVHIVIGEFSAVRWAPDGSAYNYLNDAISLFEEYEWDWAYHSFRESPIWSVEHSTKENDKTPSPTPTQRYLLLTSWFDKNKRPGGDKH